MVIPCFMDMNNGKTFLFPFTKRTIYNIFFGSLYCADVFLLDIYHNGDTAPFWMSTMGMPFF